jgi:hypothetical protein
MGKLVSAAISDPELKDFIKTNAENISLQDRLITADLNKKKIEIAGMCLDPEKGFCALADVPDLIWKQTKLRSWGRQGDENPNHYADADAPAAGGKTLFDICNSKGKLTPDKWIKYNKDIDRDITGITKDNPEKYGLLCFRVWQIYDYMVSALKGSEKKGEKLTRFLFAAGVLAHYVGDACMPLHSSYMSDGDPKDDELKNVTARRTSYHRDGSISHEAGDVYQKVVNPGKGVHSAYEDQMIDANIQMITDRLKKVLNNGNDPRYNEPIAEIDSGQAAGFASFLLMKKTQETIPPSEIVELYKKIKGPKDISKALYDQLGDRTIECLARGCRYLAAIWESAWIMGGGKNLVVGMGEDEKKVDQKALTGLYKNPAELPSLHLGSINNILQK